MSSKKGNKQKRHEGTEIYYFARRLYFEAKVVPSSKEVVHQYASKQISKMTAKEFNDRLASSTIRRWANSPDPDFDGRSWAQEWSRRITIGVLRAGEHTITGEQAFTGEDSPEIQVKSPMQELSELKQRTLQNDMRIAVGIDNFVLIAIREMLQDYEKKHRVDMVRLTQLAQFYHGSKNRIVKEVTDVEQLGDLVDPNALYGDLVPLKDPQARERVRRALKTILKLAYEKGLSAVPPDNGDGPD